MYTILINTSYTGNYIYIVNQEPTVELLIIPITKIQFVPGPVYQDTYNDAGNIICTIYCIDMYNR